MIPMAAIRISRTARAFGTLRRWSQYNGGAQRIAINTDNKNGTMIELAAFMPATTTTKAASVTKTRVERGNSESLMRRKILTRRFPWNI